MEAGPDRPAAERLNAALDAYLTYAAGNPHGFRALHRAAGADPEVRAIKEEFLALTERGIVDALTSADGPVDGPADGTADGPVDGTADATADSPVLTAGMSPEALRIAARGWLAFVVEVCLQWLDHPALSREQVRDLCVRTLLRAVGPLS
jgi:AcrR family transcriptional regulator